MERMSKEELNKRKRQKNYYLLVEKTTLYDHRNLKKMGITNVQIICWVTSSPATHIFFSNCFTFKNCHFFSKNILPFSKNPSWKKLTQFFFCFLLTQLHLGNFTCKKWKTAQKKLPNIFLLKNSHSKYTKLF